MNYKFLKALLGVILFASLFSVKTANATLIVGDVYTDTSGETWQYVGYYDLILGPDLSSNPTPLNGIEAAEQIFGLLPADQSYAISTIDTGVNHMAFYDGYQAAISGFLQLAEDAQANNAGGAGYDAIGDISAYIHDRGLTDQEADDINFVNALFGMPLVDSDEGRFLNHVFVSVTVPEPSSLAIFLLALGGFGLSRKRKL